MTNSGEYKPFEEPSRIPEFMVHFDGSQPELTEAEKDQVANGFRSLVDDLLLNHVENVTTHQYMSDVPRNRLELTKLVPEGAWNIHVVRKAQSVPAAGAQELIQGIPDYSVSLIFEDQTGETREEFAYTTDSEGVVRREDFGDLLSENMDMFLENPFFGMTEEMTPEEMDQVRQQSIDDGNRLEEEVALGLNNQPIGEAELQGLADLLLADDVIVKPPRPPV